LLAATDDTWTGRRDHLLILLLYNTGARISELLALRVQDVVGTQAKQVQLQGKGKSKGRFPCGAKLSASCAVGFKRIDFPRPCLSYLTASGNC
jgi:integrase/recombinase XerD